MLCVPETLRVLAFAVAIGSVHMAFGSFLMKFSRFGMFEFRHFLLRCSDKSQMSWVFQFNRNWRLQYEQY